MQFCTMLFLDTVETQLQTTQLPRLKNSLEEKHVGVPANKTDSDTGQLLRFINRLGEKRVGMLVCRLDRDMFWLQATTGR